MITTELSKGGAIARRVMIATAVVAGLAAPVWATPRQASLIVGFPQLINGQQLRLEESVGFTVSPSGAVAFGGRFENFGDPGVWTATPGQLTTIARRGVPISGPIPPTFNANTDTPIVQNAGAAYFSASTRAADGFTISYGIWRGNGASATPVFTSGQTLPGLSPGVTLTPNSNGLGYFRLDSVSPDGTLYATVPLAGPGINSTNSTALAVSDAGGTRLLLQNNTVIPGTATVATNAQVARVMSGGRGLFNITSPDGVNTFNAVWSYDGSAWTRQIGTGTPVPGIGASTLYSPQAMTSSEGGGVLFRGSIGFPVIQGAQWGLWRRDVDGTMSFLVRNNAPVPGLAGWVTNSDAPSGLAMNDNGTSVYMARMTNDANPYLWSMVVTTPTSTQIIARENQALPGGMFSRFGPSTSTTEMNAFGQFAFQLGVSPTGSGSLDPAVYGYSPDIGLFSIASPGDQIQLNGGAVRTVAAALLANELSTNNQTRSGLLGNGMVVVYVAFTDGTQAIIATPIPGGGSAGLLTLGALAAARRRRR